MSIGVPLKGNDPPRVVGEGVNTAEVDTVDVETVADGEGGKLEVATAGEVGGGVEVGGDAEVEAPLLKLGITAPASAILKASSLAGSSRVLDQL